LGQAAALRARGEGRRRAAEAEAEIIADARDREPSSLVDLLGTDEGSGIELEPERLGLTAHDPDL
jgi:plasmid stability protein